MGQKVNSELLRIYISELQCRNKSNRKGRSSNINPITIQNTSLLFQIDTEQGQLDISLFEQIMHRNSDTKQNQMVN